MKRLIVVIAGTEGRQEIKDVDLQEGARVRDVLAGLGLVGFQLGTPDGGAFGFGDDLYAAVADGQKLYASKADVEAGE